MLKPFIILILMNVVWSGSYVAVKIGLETMPPLALIFWRMGVSAIILCVWVFVKRIPFKLPKRVLVRVAALGTMTAISHILWVTGLKYTNASDAALLYTFEPIWAIALASIVLKERFRPVMGVGLLLSFTGLVILSRVSFSTIDQLFGASVAFGNMLIVVGLFCESSFSIVAKPLADKTSAAVAIAGALIVTDLITAVPLALSGEFAFPKTSTEIAAILYLSIPCTVVGYVLWIKTMRKLPVNVMCYTIFVQPIVGPVIAVVTLGETMGSRAFAGGAFLLAGVFVAVFSHVRAHRAKTCLPISQPVTL